MTYGRLPPPVLPVVPKKTVKRAKALEEIRKEQIRRLNETKRPKLRLEDYPDDDTPVKRIGDDEDDEELDTGAIRSHDIGAFKAADLD